MELVQCNEQYWEFVRQLRMDERVSNGFIETTPITKEQQANYMSSNSQHYRIALIDGSPVGYIGVIDDDIRVCVHPTFQKRGVGKFMIVEGMQIWKNACAKVKIGNTASDNLFISAGFKKIKKDTNFTYYKKHNIFKITILTDNPNSWIIPYVEILKNELHNLYEINHVFDISDITNGDIMLILSCEKILKAEYLKFHKSNVVVHPSKLPLGKGWSPLAWQILHGFNDIPVSLFEATENVDSGDVYIVDYIRLQGHELNNEIKQKQGLLTIKMVKQYIEQFTEITGVPQIGEDTFYPRRRQTENELDINKSITDHFNLLRVVDNERYPAHFYIHGKKYILKIYKDDKP
jgi:methionyl-tRNA formyltransferase